MLDLGVTHIINCAEQVDHLVNDVANDEVDCGIYKEWLILSMLWIAFHIISLFSDDDGKQFDYDDREVDDENGELVGRINAVCEDVPKNDNNNNNHYVSMDPTITITKTITNNFAGCEDGPKKNNINNKQKQ